LPREAREEAKAGSGHQAMLELHLGRDLSSVGSPVGVLDVSYPKQVPQYVHFIPRSLAHAFKGALVDGAQTFRLSVKLTSGSE
jgi:hypothetical protein